MRTVNKNENGSNMTKKVQEYPQPDDQDFKPFESTNIEAVFGKTAKKNRLQPVKGHSVGKISSSIKEK